MAAIESLLWSDCRIGLQERSAHIITSRAAGRNKGCATVLGGTNVANHIEILCQKQQIHDVLGVGRGLAGKLHNRGFQTVDDSLSLAGNTHSRQIQCLGTGLGRLDLQNLVSLGPLRDGVLESFGGVDLVHGVLDTLVRVEIRDEGLENLISIGSEGFREGGFDRGGKFFLGLEGSVELKGREGGSHHIVNVGTETGLFGMVEARNRWQKELLKHE